MQRQTAHKHGRAASSSECKGDLAATIHALFEIFQDAAIALSRFWNFRTQAEQMPSESEFRDLD
jgi:hypothetical protein